MKLWEMVKVALEGIWANKLRSGLTMLGIIIGVLSVIIVVTLGQGGQAKILTEMESIGTNLFVVYMGSVEDGDWNKYKLTLDDCRVIRESVDSISELVPEVYGGSAVQSRRKKVTATVIGTEAEYATIRKVKMMEGRFFNSIDSAVSRRVAVINQKMAEDLFGSAQEAIGQKITVRQVPVIVCGVTQANSAMFGQERPTLYMPIKLHFRLFDSSDSIFQVEGSAVSQDKVKEAAEQAVRILEVRHKAKDKNVYRFETMEQYMETTNKITGILTMIIGAIAGISLLVGGIGIMNIMLVSVTERTREIGIRMAVGARREDILVQFLIESVVLSLTGGLLGMLLGIGASALICMVLKVPFVLSYKTIILAIIFSVAVGIFFGLYPANKAAKQDPIEALRYE